MVSNWPPLYVCGLRRSGRNEKREKWERRAGIGEVEETAMIKMLIIIIIIINQHVKLVH